jgi:hypothetical protein
VTLLGEPDGPAMDKEVGILLATKMNMHDPLNAASRERNSRNRLFSEYSTSMYDMPAEAASGELLSGAPSAASDETSSGIIL